MSKNSKAIFITMFAILLLGVIISTSYDARNLFSFLLWGRGSKHYFIDSIVYCYRNAVNMSLWCTVILPIPIIAYGLCSSQKNRNAIFIPAIIQICVSIPSYLIICGLEYALSIIDSSNAQYVICGVGVLIFTAAFIVALVTCVSIINNGNKKKLHESNDKVLNG